MNETNSGGANNDVNELQRLKAKIESAWNRLLRLFKEWVESVGDTAHYWMGEGDLIEEKREWLAVTNWDESS